MSHSNRTTTSTVDTTLCPDRKEANLSTHLDLCVSSAAHENHSKTSLGSCHDLSPKSEKDKTLYDPTSQCASTRSVLFTRKNTPSSLLPKVAGESRETIADGTNVQDMRLDGASGIPLRGRVKQPEVTTPNSCRIHRHVTAGAPLSAEIRESRAVRNTVRRSPTGAEHKGHPRRTPR